MPNVPIRMTIAVAAAALLAACNRGQANSASDSANGALSDTGMPSAMAPANSASTALGSGAMAGAPTSPDAGVLSAVADEDSAEILVARLAETKATSASVKTYARQLATDHAKGLKAADSLASTLSLSAPAMGAKVSGASTVLARLNAMPKGMAFDTAFVNQEVSDHQSDLPNIQQDTTTAQSTAVKALLKKQIGQMRTHLNRGKTIQTELAKKHG